MPSSCKPLSCKSSNQACTIGGTGCETSGHFPCRTMFCQKVQQFAGILCFLRNHCGTGNLRHVAFGEWQRRDAPQMRFGLFLATTHLDGSPPSIRAGYRPKRQTTEVTPARLDHVSPQLHHQAKVQSADTSGTPARRQSSPASIIPQPATRPCSTRQRQEYPNFAMSHCWCILENPINQRDGDGTFGTGPYDVTLPCGCTKSRHPRCFVPLNAQGLAPRRRCSDPVSCCHQPQRISNQIGGNDTHNRQRQFCIEMQRHCENRTNLRRNLS
ncbi:hypothetical protein GQR58_030625 [Nymphon striatum]|nr:hypothetical protein GQR58_030625 [Nymphon striatum]